MKLALGTVQFGLDYGLTNAGGKCPESEVRKILSAAAQSGIDLLDTAPSYGESERVLGRTIEPDFNCRIVTKTPGLQGRLIEDAVLEEVNACLSNTLSNLKRSVVYGLLVHHCDDLFASGGHRLFSALQSMKDEGRVSKIGVSVYTAEQIDRVLTQFDIDIVQLPLNLLDQRLLESGHLHKLKAAGIEIHARSVFLQGLVLMRPDDCPNYFRTIKPSLQKLHKDCLEARTTPLGAALAFVSGINEVDRLVVGVTSAREFDEVLDAFRDETAKGLDFNVYATKDDGIFNPENWPIRVQ